MGKSNGPSPLYEVIRKKEPKTKPKKSTSTWARVEREPAAPRHPRWNEPSEASVPAPAPPAAPPPSPPPPSAGEDSAPPAPPREKEGSRPKRASWLERAGQWLGRKERDQSWRQRGRTISGWLGHPITMRFPRGTLVLFALCGVTLIVAAFLIGRKQGAQARLSPPAVAGTGRTTLEDIRRERPNPELIPAGVGLTGTHAGASAVSRTVAPPPHARSQGRNVARRAQGRVPGLNYYRLVTIPASAADYAQRAVDFLARHGIQAAAVPADDDSLKLIVLRGFKHPYSNPQAKAFAQHLRSLGQLWDHEHNGTSDWSGLIPEKYQPGE